jgi:CelD/BcsL family acetyltransferase involved in cellulose biosynthesis
LIATVVVARVTMDGESRDRPTRDGMLQKLNPLTDLRWRRFVDRHPNSSAFHSVAWMQALSRTCGYEPVVYTTAVPGDELEDGIAFCKVRSRLTGARLVSMPFADHCDPLTSEENLFEKLYPVLGEMLRNGEVRYCELRPRGALLGNLAPELLHSTYTYDMHVLDLTPDVDTLFQNLHKHSTKRKVKRAEREGLVYTEGTSDALLESFYRLLVLTRRRHGVPPQPKAWFRNLIECFAESLKIRVASINGQPIASLLTLRHKDTLVFKYGCSDTRFNALGGVHLLLWRSILDAKQSGLTQFDLGRSNRENTGLVTFKNRWGAGSAPLTYSRFSLTPASFFNLNSNTEPWKTRVVRQFVSSLPTPLFRSAGAILFRHFG